MMKHLLVVPQPVFSFSKIMITISKFEKGPKPGDNMLKYTNRIGCSALTDLILKCFSDTSVPRFWITPLHFILTYS